MRFTYILNIDIDIAIFCKYRINIVSKLKSNIEASLFAMQRRPASSVPLLCI